MKCLRLQLLHGVQDCKGDDGSVDKRIQQGFSLQNLVQLPTKTKIIINYNYKRL